MFMPLHEPRPLTRTRPGEIRQAGLATALAIMLLPTLSGCGLLQQQREDYQRDQQLRRAAEAQRQAALFEKYQAQLISECMGFGFREDSAELKSCVEQIRRLDEIRQMQVNQQSQLQFRCRAIYSSTLLSPTKSGSAGESFVNAANAYNNCMAGLPPLKTGPRNFYCSPINHGLVSCLEQ